MVVKQYWGSVRSALRGSQMPSDRVTAATYLEADLSANHQDRFFHLGLKADMKNEHSPESLLYPGLIKFAFLQFLCNKVIDRMDGHKSRRLGNQTIGVLWLISLVSCRADLCRLAPQRSGGHSEHTGWARIGPPAGFTRIASAIAWCFGLIIVRGES